jgi:hypothetical protein
MAAYQYLRDHEGGGDFGDSAVQTYTRKLQELAQSVQAATSPEHPSVLLTAYQQGQRAPSVETAFKNAVAAFTNVTLARLSGREGAKVLYVVMRGINLQRDERDFIMRPTSLLYNISELLAIRLDGTTTSQKYAELPEEILEKLGINELPEERKWPVAGLILPMAAYVVLSRQYTTETLDRTYREFCEMFHVAHVPQKRLEHGAATYPQRTLLLVEMVSYSKNWMAITAAKSAKKLDPQLAIVWAATRTLATPTPKHASDTLHVWIEFQRKMSGALEFVQRFSAAAPEMGLQSSKAISPALLSQLTIDTLLEPRVALLEQLGAWWQDIITRPGAVQIASLPGYTDVKALMELYGTAVNMARSYQTQASPRLEAAINTLTWKDDMLNVYTTRATMLGRADLLDTHANWLVPAISGVQGIVPTDAFRSLLHKRDFERMASMALVPCPVQKDVDGFLQVHGSLSLQLDWLRNYLAANHPIETAANFLLAIAHDSFQFMNGIHDLQLLRILPWKPQPIGFTTKFTTAYAPQFNDKTPLGVVRDLCAQLQVIARLVGHTPTIDLTPTYLGEAWEVARALHLQPICPSPVPPVTETVLSTSKQVLADWFSGDRTKTPEEAHVVSLASALFQLATNHIVVPSRVDPQHALLYTAASILQVAPAAGRMDEPWAIAVRNMLPLVILAMLDYTRLCTLHGVATANNIFYDVNEIITVVISNKPYTKPPRMLETNMDAPRWQARQQTVRVVGYFTLHDIRTRHADVSLATALSLLLVSPHTLLTLEMITDILANDKIPGTIGQLLRLVPYKYVKPVLYRGASLEDETLAYIYAMLPTVSTPQIPATWIDMTLLRAKSLTKDVMSSQTSAEMKSFLRLFNYFILMRWMYSYDCFSNLLAVASAVRAGRNEMPVHGILLEHAAALFKTLRV